MSPLLLSVVCRAYCPAMWIKGLRFFFLFIYIYYIIKKKEGYIYVHFFFF